MVQAQYAATCAACHEQVEPGESIRHSDRLEAWVHQSCPDPTPPAKRLVCDRCWQEKSASGACGCDDE